MRIIRKRKITTFIKWLSLIWLACMPEIIAFAPYMAGVALTTAFLGGVMTYMIIILGNSRKVLRNNKQSIIDEKAINKDLTKALILMTLATLMITFILIKFLYSSSMQSWWLSWYTSEAMIIWYVAIETVAIISSLFLLSVLLRKAISKMNKSIKKLFINVFSLFKKSIKAVSKLWKLILGFTKRMLDKFLTSEEKNNRFNIDNSNIESSIHKDSFLVTTKKATWPPLF